jgi:hypothetical protein
MLTSRIAPDPRPEGRRGSSPRPEGAWKHSPGFTQGLPWVCCFIASRPEGAAENMEICQPRGTRFSAAPFRAVAENI